MQQGHDIVFKTVFEDPACAREHFERVLSAEARRLVDLTTLELVPGSFVDEAFKARHTDLLFRATARDGTEREAFVYLLFEHQSTAQSLMVFRLYCYMANIWRRHVETSKRALPLPPIVSLVLYNGTRRWRAARTFHELVQPLGKLGPRVPQFEMVLPDLGACSDDLLGVETSAGRARLMLRRGPRARGPASLARLGPILRAAATDSAMKRTARLRQLKVFAHYLLQVAKRVERAQVMDLIARHAGEDGRKMVMSLRDELVAEGLAEGLAKGRSEGQAEILLKQLTLRFGAPDDETVRRVQEASEAELVLWAERILTAASVEDVLDG